MGLFGVGLGDSTVSAWKPKRSARFSIITRPEQMESWLMHIFILIYVRIGVYLYLYMHVLVWRGLVWSGLFYKKDMYN
jgi:hypothetical protein